ncbi:MAG: hypothetical protein IJY60_01485, partial [Bacteroides sp.]|nr:hypothetical protein [Bacteroides sp.]
MIVDAFCFIGKLLYFLEKNAKIPIGVNRSANRILTSKVMSIKVSVICFKSKVLANGEHPIVLRITENKKRVTKSLGISVKPQHWDFKKEEPKPKCPNRDLIISIILKVKSEYQSKILEKIAHEEEFTASSLIHEQKDDIKAMTVDDFYKQLINE